MNKFVYRAKDKEGRTVTGVVEGSSAQAAAYTLQDHGLLVIGISEKRTWSLAMVKPGGNSASGREVATFTRLLATMMKAGLPLVEALENLSRQSKSVYFREVVVSLLQDVKSGRSLSGAMKNYPAVFPPLYISLVKAGEASGKVDSAMERLADMLEADLEFKGKIKGAMIYPAIVTVAMVGVAVFMLTTIVPRVADVYKDFGAELPLPTRVMISFSEIVINYAVFVLIGLAAAVFAFRTLRKNPSTDRLINDAFLKAPVMGSLNCDVMVANLTRTLGTLVESGVALLDAIKVVAEGIDRNKYREALEEAARAVEKGLPMSSALGNGEVFEPIVGQLTAIGEETGTLGESFMRLSRYYQESAERKVKALTTALEPLMILLMGGMVGGLAIAVLLPMFNLVNVIK